MRRRESSCVSSGDLSIYTWSFAASCLAFDTEGSLSKQIHWPLFHEHKCVPQGSPTLFLQRATLTKSTGPRATILHRYITDRAGDTIVHNYSALQTIILFEVSSKFLAPWFAIPKSDVRYQHQLSSESSKTGMILYQIEHDVWIYVRYFHRGSIPCVPLLWDLFQYLLSRQRATGSSRATCRETPGAFESICQTSCHQFCVLTYVCTLMFFTGEEHYNCISALHKSMRGSHENAALYWLGRMLEGGEDPLYVARRLVRFASEDVGVWPALYLSCLIICSAFS